MSEMRPLGEYRADDGFLRYVFVNRFRGGVVVCTRPEYTPENMRGGMWNTEYEAVAYIKRNGGTIYPSPYSDIYDRIS